MFGTRYEILRHVLREAEAYTNRIRGSRLQRVVPLKITNVPPSPSLNMFVTYGPSNTSESSQEMKNHKFRNLRSYRGWLKIGWKTVYPAIFSIFDHRPFLLDAWESSLRGEKLREYRLWIFNEEKTADLEW